jgi:RHS repeat-associated protein
MPPETVSFPNGDQVLCEYEGDSDYTAGILTRTFVYGPGIDEPVRMSIMPKMDIDGDGNSTMADVDIMRNTWLLRGQDTGFDSRADLNHDGVVNNIDADILAGNWKVVRQNAARYYYHFDGLGSVTALSDKDGQTVETYRYSVFGDTAIYNASGKRLAASAVGNVYCFTGRRLDTETGLYYYRARIYSPHLGRFLQSDPIGYEDSMCLYLYCENNPIIFVDPYGELPEWAWRLLAKTPTAPQGATDFVAGMGDNLSFGATKLIREAGGFNDQVNTDSGIYKAGEWTGTALSTSIGVAGGLKAAGSKAAGKQFSHWIPDRTLKKTGSNFLRNTFGKSSAVSIK